MSQKILLGFLIKKGVKPVAKKGLKKAIVISRKKNPDVSCYSILNKSVAKFEAVFRLRTIKKGGRSHIAGGIVSKDQRTRLSAFNFCKQVRAQNNLPFFKSSGLIFTAFNQEAPMQKKISAYKLAEKNRLPYVYYYTSY